MARRGRPTVQIELTGNERKTVERWARRRSSAQSLALRCRIVLAGAEGAPPFPFKGTELVAVGVLSSNSRSDRKHRSYAPVTSCPRPGTP